MATDNILPYGRQTIDRTDVAAVAAVVGSDFLTTGPAVAEFERGLCEATGARYAVACSNGTTALHLACLAIGLKQGEWGITSPNTFLASANCFEFCGASTDFVDIDETLCLSPGRLEHYCATVRVPKVVVAVDFAGVPSSLPRIRELSQRLGFALIEDAAHALGSSYVHDGVEYRCGGCGHADLAILSFHPVKTITTGEGGAICTNDADLAGRLRLFRSHGMTKDPVQLTRHDGGWYYEMAELGYNYRITDLQCALGSSQLIRLPAFKKRRQEIVRQYNDAFAQRTDVIVPPWPKQTDPCFHLYTLQFAGGAPVRRRVYDALLAERILAQVHYFPVHLQPYYSRKYGYAAGKCPLAEGYYSGCLSLPLFPGMSNGDVERVIDAVTRVIG